MTTIPTDNPIVKVARDLTEIGRCFEELRAQAIADGGNPDIPGGAAMVALGPVADLETWANLNDTTAAYQNHPDEHLRRIFTSEPDEDDDDRWPPQQVIAYWAGRWRAARGEDYDGLIRTTPSEMNYLRQTLDWALENESQWATFTTDIRRARLVAENLVAEGYRADRSRIVCDRDGCEKNPRLIKAYSPRYLAGWRCHGCDTFTPAEYRCTDRNHLQPPSAAPCDRLTGPRKARVRCSSPTVMVTDPPAACFNTRCSSFDPPAEVLASDPSRDGWKCPSCKHRYTDDELIRAHGRMLWRPEAERWVRMQEAVATLKSQGRGERTVRRWLAPRLELVDRCTECAAMWEHQEHPACPATLPPEEKGGDPVECGGLLEERWHGDAEAVVAGWCDPATHVTWLWWPDLWRLHLTTRTTPRTPGMMSA